ncbi:MAG: GAF domain-containing protein [Verrucomicrobia bacterium]|jgi:GAF domain-containing protein|nr:GAF domain-containing protein [Verrucomicrobiota bacterium]
MKAPLPENEAQRVAALREYHILDTAAEHAYDDITALAAYLCDVPIALISLMDESRQWFKSKLGLNLRETPRDVAFCAHTILQSKPLIVRDALKSARFADNPLVRRSPNIRFYAGFPLVSPEGFALGTLCAIDRIPRQISAVQKRAMQGLARQVLALLEFRRVSARMAEALEQVKTLHGLLPICAWCKRIRDDQGYWSQVEAYLHTQTGADFTHGICPECLAKQRPKKPPEE